MRTPFVRFVSIAIMSGALAQAGCKKPIPVLVAPKDVHTPQLDPDRLAATEAAKTGRNGEVKVAYCIDTEGATKDVRVVAPLDPEIDAIALETVQSWRYEPALRDGRPYEMCTDITFVVHLAAPGG